MTSTNLPKWKVFCNCKGLFLINLCIATILIGILLTTIIAVCKDTPGVRIENGQLKCGFRNDTVTPQHPTLYREPGVHYDSTANGQSTLNTGIKIVVVLFLTSLMVCFVLVALYNVVLVRWTKLNAMADSAYLKNIQDCFEERVDVVNDKAKLLLPDNQHMV